VPDGLQNQRDAVSEGARGHIDGLEPEVAIGLLMHLLEHERLLEADPPGGGGRNEALVTDEENVGSYVRSATTRLTSSASRGDVE
jgi:hypothetical protein